jgi:hypothetical protein
MKPAVQAVLISVAAAAACFAMLVAAALLLPQDHKSIRLHLIDSIMSGEMAPQTRIGLALALMPLLLALGFRGDGLAYLGRLARLWTCFCIAVIASFAIKKLFTVVFFGDSESFLNALLHRTYGQLEASTDAHYSVGYLIATYFAWSAWIVYGSRHIGAALILASLATIALMSWQRRNARTSDLKVLNWPAGSACLRLRSGWWSFSITHCCMRSSWSGSSSCPSSPQPC